MELVPDDESGLLDIRPARKAKPVNARPGVPSQSIEEYLKQIAQRTKDIAALQDVISKQLEERTALALEIAGRAEPKVKGLRTKLSEQEEIARAAELETKYLDDYINTRDAERRILRKRQAALEARKQELAR